MGHGAEHQIEHAEQAAHAAHDTFNTRVTISIATIAAVLAAVSILGHKAHNMMLSLQQQAGIKKSQAANKWSQFQAYNIRSHLYQGLGELGEFTAPAANAEEKRAKALEGWAKRRDKYEGKDMPKTSEEAKEFERQSDDLLEQSAFWHHKAERLDLGDLGLQLGVVLASMAILTKRRSFWFGGLASALLGFAVAMTGHFGVWLGEHSAHEDQGKKEHASETKAH